jgi:hypothetical protein
MWRLLVASVTMVNETESDEDYLAAIHRGRAHLVEQIQRSQEIIDQSKELIKRMDEILAKSGLKP